MKTLAGSTPRLISLTLFAILLFVFPAAFSPAGAEPMTAADQVTQAWQLAQASGRYEYNSEVSQTSYPAAKLSNTGRQPETEFLAVQGWVNLPENQLEMSLWQDPGRNPAGAISLKVENGQTLARYGAEEWQKIDNITESFAPNQDPLGFLASATHIQAAGTEERQLGDVTLIFTKYHFELDGPAYARQMQAKMEAQLRQHGRLPAGLRLSTAEMYAQTSGRGEFWLTAEGLPARLTLSLEIPATTQSGRVTADITTDFANFDRERITTATTSFWHNPAGWLAFRQEKLAEATQQLALTFALSLLVVAAGLLTMRYWESKTFQTIVTMSYIFALLVPPLIDANQAQAFGDSLRSAAAKQAAEQEEAEERAKAQAALSHSSWNPRQNPLLSAELKAMAHKNRANTTTLAPTNTDTTDSDNDGLSDADEEYWGSCGYLSGTAEYNDDPACTFDTTTTEDNVDPLDSDGDGLGDYAEVYDLGILPAQADTDSDGIWDGLEVRGFTDTNNTTWYLDPGEPDSNKDGFMDGAECPVWFHGSPDYDSTADCPDTDGDGLPDLFDADNDNDLVADEFDLSPNSSGNETYSQENQLAFTANNLEVGETVLLDLQLRPVLADNLTLYNHVLDWPTGDTHGQITRQLDTTWANSTNSDLRSTAANAGNGDIRLIPMIEITMPYADGHYANLPITSTAPSTRVLGEEVETWLDNSALDPFGIEVADLDVEEGSLVAYAPLSAVTDQYNKTVAFSAQMVYRPSQGSNNVVNWGSAHQFRLVWIVQMLTDECIDETADPATCARQDIQTVIHTYDDPWQLTGLNVRESHNLESAVVYEDPAADEDLSLDDQLWLISWNLANTLMRGRDCDVLNGTTCTSDGERDVTVSNLEADINDWLGAESYTVVETSSYSHEGYMAYVPSGVGAGVLEDMFTPYATSTIPTLMYVHEYENRSLSLDSYENPINNSLIFDFDPEEVKDEVYVTMSWTPYDYVGGEWQGYDSENYLNLLASRLELETYFQPEDSSEASQSLARGKIVWAQSYYASLLQGATALVEIDGGVLLAAMATTLSEDILQPIIASGVTVGAETILTSYFEIFTRATAVGVATHYRTANWIDGALSFFQEIGRSYDEAVNPYTLKFNHQSKWLPQKINVLSGLFIGIMLLGAILLMAGYFSGNRSVFRAGIIVMSVLTIIVTVVYAINAILAIVQAIRAIGTLTLAMVNAASKAARGFQGAGILGTLIAFGVAWGFFFAQLGSVSGISLFVALSQAIAASIIAIVYLVLDLIGLGLVVMIIALIDAILAIAGETGATDWLTNQLAEALYDVNMVMTNLNASDRLQVKMSNFEFADPNLGFVANNSLIFTYAVTNTAAYNDDYSFSTAAYRNVFRYFLDTTAEDQHEGLELGEMSDEWADVGNDRMRATDSFDLTLSLGSVGSGLNKQLSAYITEAYLISYEGCWFYDGWFGANGCSWEEYADSSHINVGEYLVYDILPSDVNQFANMTWHDTHLALAPTNNSLTLRSQIDLDNDGLPRTNGTDPDDSTADTDSDGLPDGYEVANGYNPSAADGDNDGLNDAEELRHRTNPFLKDSDGDGLNDYIEAKVGWLVVYNGNQLTRVWSDPNVADADGDSLTDFDEFLFGLNPWVTTDPSVIDNLVQFDNLTVQEQSHLQLLLQFEETALAQTFLDSSGRGHQATCPANCPTAAVTGRYGSAASFDGSQWLNSYSGVTELGKADFTLSAWVKTTATSVGILSKNDGDSTWETREKSFYLNSDGMPTFVGFGNNYIRSNTAVNDGQWHHVAVVWDYSGSGTAGVGKMYVDGVDHTGTVGYAANNPDEATHTLKVGAGNSNVNEAGSHFVGLLDEVAAFNTALSAAEIENLFYGRYNPSDLLLQPATTLLYQATITNSSSTTATGHLVAETAYLDPQIEQPYVALSFENEQRLAYFANNMGEENAISCVDDGHCPTAGIDGYHSNALDFDGVNDYALLPTLNVDDDFFHLSFFLQVDVLPAAGATAMILDTATTEPGNMDIYLNSSGNLVFQEVGGTSVTTNYSFSGNLGNWVHVAYNGYKIYINANSNTNDTFHFSRIGSGRLGNSLDGSKPFNGAIDAFVYYDHAADDGTSGGTSYNEIATIRDGNYTFTEGNTNGEIENPEALFKLDELIQYDGTVFYDTQTNSNHATCSVPTCPTLITNGYENKSVTFDGVDDFISQPGTFNTGSEGEATVEFWLRMSQNPAVNAYILDTTSGTDVLDMYITPAGKLVADRQEGVHTSTGSIPLNQWVRVTLVYDKYFSGGMNRYDSRISFNGTLDSTRNYHSSSTTTGWAIALGIGPARIGNNAAGTNPLSGSLDNLNIQVANHTFDPPVTNLGYLDLATDLRTATCTDVFVCPDVTSGRFGDAAEFDGNDVVTVRRGSSFVGNGQFTQAVWIYPTPADNSFYGFMGYHSTATNTRAPSLWVTEMTKIHGGFGDGSNWNNFTTGSVLTTNAWNHVLATFDGTTYTLYVNGTVAYTTTAWSGRIPYPNSLLTIGKVDTHFIGKVDEAIFLPVAVNAAGAQLLMNSTYPIVAIDELFQSFSTPAVSSQTVTGAAEVSPYAVSSLHSFNQEVEAALELQTQIEYPVVDDNSASLGLFMPFEDTPGSIEFTNLADYGNVYRPGICTAPACPTAGLRGHIGRAAYFDGVDDFLYLDLFEPYVTYDNRPDFRTFSAWVNAKQGTLFTAMRSGYSVQVDMNRLHYKDDGGNAQAQKTLSLPLPREQWFHLAVTIDGSAVARVYVNGAEVNTGDLNFVTKIEDIFIGSNHSGQDYLEGFMDDIRLYSTTLTAGQILTLYQESAPALHFEFDEDASFTAFTDNTIYEYVGLPSSTTYVDPVLNETVTKYNPLPGTDGKIGNTALFDGEGFITVPTAGDNINLIGEFSAMAWVKTEATSQGILVKTDGDSSWEQGEKAFYLDANGRPVFVGWGNNYIRGSEAVNDEFWHQVVVTWDPATSTGRMYVDGADVTSQDNYNPNNADRPADTLKIGASNHNVNEAAGNFVGQIDELVVYTRALTAAEIFSIYLREYRWYRATTYNTLQIDTTPPTVELLSQESGYWPDGYIQLAVATQDIHSRVTLLDFGLKRPSDSSFSWQGASVCTEAAATNSAWCPNFETDGQGVYEVQFRAVDAVGNETLSPVYTLWVDGQAPAVPTTYNNTWLDVTSTGELAWTVTLNSTISDPEIAAGIAGSGVYPLLKVALLDGTGGLMADGWQETAVSGNSWSLAYQINGQKPTGQYTVMVEVEDLVGNVSSLAIGTINLDARAPQAQNNDWESPSQTTFNLAGQAVQQLNDTPVISTTTDFSGVVVEQPNWGDYTAEFHFEQGTTTFYDSSDHLNHASCTGADCPVLTSGLFGQAADFDGVDDVIFIPANETLNIGPNLTLAAWIRPDNVSSGLDRYITVNQQAVLRMRNGNLNFFVILDGTLHHVDVSNILTAGVWQHISATYDGQTMRLYHNGVEIAQNEVSGSMTAATNAYFSGVNEPYDGQMDEALIIGRALSAGEIYALAQDTFTGIQTVEYALANHDFSGTNPPTLSWQPATVSQNSWSFTLAGEREGFFDLSLRSSDQNDNGNTPSVIWRGMIDTIPPVVVASGQQLGGGSAAETEYSFTFTDFVLDEATFVHPCGTAVSELIYTDETMPHNGLPYEVSGSCRVSGHETSRDFTTCDAAGHCSTQTVTPAPSTSGNLLITSPATGSIWLVGQEIPILGGGFAPDMIQAIEILVNGQPLATLPYGGTTTNADWSTTWTPSSSGQYTITAVLTSVGNQSYQDSVQVTVTGHLLMVNKIGSGLVQSDPAGINCDPDCAAGFEPGTVITLTATPDNGSTFAGWSGACTGAGACVVTMSQTQEVTATFGLGTFSLTVLKDGMGAGLVQSDPAGIECGLDCVEVVEFGTVITLTATPDNGSIFTGWGGACSGTAVCVVTVDQAQEVTATFELVVVPAGYTIFLPVVVR